MHLLNAVREEVTELRQQIRTLNEKVSSLEHENLFLRQHVPSEIYAQYTPLFGTTSTNDTSNPTTTTTTIVPPNPSSSSQANSMVSLSSLPSSLPQHINSLTTAQATPQSINLPPT